MSKNHDCALPVKAVSGQRRLSRRLLAMVVRPSAPPLWLGIIVAAAFIIAETLMVHVLREVASNTAFGALFLLGVLVVSAGWGFPIAVATSLASALVYGYFHLVATAGLAPLKINDVVAVFVFLPIALLANVLAREARLRAAESERRLLEVAALAEQQAALRRVATLVARGVDSTEVYSTAVAELSRFLGGVANVVLLRYVSDGASVLLASRGEHRVPRMLVGERIPFDGENVATIIRHTEKSARLDSYEHVTGSVAERMNQLGIRSAAGAPIVVDRRLWGALVIGSAQSEPMPPEIEARIGDFADLVAIAISNAQTRAELTASRARIVTAGDQARRRFERDLHDGAQQRVVSLGLQLRDFEASIPPEQRNLRDRIAHLIAEIRLVSTELQEFSRGIHPAIVSKGGLGRAIKSLARQSAIPVTLDLGLDVDRRMPEAVEVAAYYVVAEVLTNAAKHSQASEVSIRVTAGNDQLRLVICDDGIGGAVVGKGSGLIGLKDRVEALGGRLDISSPAGSGTTLVVVIPLDVKSAVLATGPDTSLLPTSDRRQRSSFESR
ncbi:ATP-binding protein [Mycobacterium sp. 1274761.0]|uniref:sensor histidine kinase n=1 Tax=Mycobacterium sp. 1274761.0 TaxID=1834077 RepID=UPI000A82C3E0|nr:ATP-binding protein [Mycobacterium sp. 1274761.0]